MKRIYKLKVLALILNLFLIEETMRLGFSSVLFDRRKLDSMERALVLNPSDAELNFRLARVYQLAILEDDKRIETLYARSLELNPLLSPSWLGLTEVFADNGEKQKALTALRRASEIAPFYIARLWEGAILALRLGDKSMAAENLRTVVKTDQMRRIMVFDTSWQLIGDPELILNEIVADEALSDYLRYLIVRNKLEETFPVWERMKKAGVVSEEVVFYYVEFLAARDRTHRALSIWDETFGEREDDSLVWNGGFESEPIGGGWGFDWKIAKVDGIEIEFDWKKRFRGSYSLSLRFDGKHNVDFHHVYQIVPVEPDTDYVFASYVATDDVTTTNGINWEVVCYPRLNMRVATEPVVGTNEWERIELPFHTLSDCKSVLVTLRRYISTKIDRYISGVAWVDDVKIYKARVNANAQGGEKGI